DLLDVCGMRRAPMDTWGVRILHRPISGNRYSTVQLARAGTFGCVHCRATATPASGVLDLRFEPPADRVEHLTPVVLQHHEVPVAEDALVFEIEFLGVDARLLQESNSRRAVPAGAFGDDVDG